MSLQFGTDGIRGDAEADLTSPLVVALGRAAARVLRCDRPFLVGRDTRESGPRLATDLAAGLRAEGCEVVSVGVLPTPGVAHLAGLEGSPAAMISASHNHFRDNGIKLFAPGGRKLPDDAEEAIESELAALLAGSAGEAPSTRAPLPARDGALATYVEHLVAAIEGRRLDGLRVALDCANGAASDAAPAVLRRLGADVSVIGATPDGRNINDGCGSTAPGPLQEAVVAVGADLGLALDGDADRVIAVDERGELVDGDHLLVIAALDLQEHGRLRGDAVAVTVMSNLGLHRALRAAGIGVVETAVGDRQVLAAMERDDLALGGEQSGHVIFRDLASTGDGTLTGLLLADRVLRSRRPLSDLAAVMETVPQLLESVRVARRGDPAADAAISDAVHAVEQELGDTGRVLVRASGTEPVIRIMVEAPTSATAHEALARLRAAVVGALGEA